MKETARLLRLALIISVIVLVPSCGKKGDPLPPAATSGAISGIQEGGAEGGGAAVDVRETQEDTGGGATGG